jgi:uncharacterized protein with von Willebrand factor type A (vWA) domain
VVNLELTQDGESLCEVLYPSEVDALDENFAQLEPAQFQDLLRSLRMLRNRGADLRISAGQRLSRRRLPKPLSCRSISMQSWAIT